ncbi:MAG: hypothetical protein UR65_C0079G0004 [Candidatus Moranbacteria bacterium GW2011_GWE2_35_164]|nr:MAG: hypothetical protein UR65_C0079G0004 [Candidatus Moranbacteria bacterium GW2011_GWE2_35_164]
MVRTYVSKYFNRLCEEVLYSKRRGNLEILFRRLYLESNVNRRRLSRNLRVLKLLAKTIKK